MSLGISSRFLANGAALLLLSPAMAAAPAAPASFPISDQSFKLRHADDACPAFLCRQSGRQLEGHRQGGGSDHRNLSRRLGTAARAHRGDGETRERLQCGDARLGVLRAQCLPGWDLPSARADFRKSNNRFGGNCFTCHIKAHPEFDLVCDNNHGCDPIPITRAMSGALQHTDPRCKNPPASAEDAAALAQLGAIVKAMAAAKAPASTPESAPKN